MTLPDGFVTVRRRARPMAPEDRRDAIVSATIPLLAEQGRGVTTRQIAEAAGVAEGTIFRVFADKDALIDAAVQKMLDPLPLRAALRGIDIELPLEQKLHDILFHLRARFVGVFGIMTALGLRERPPIPGEGQQLWREIIVELLEPDADQLAVPVHTVAYYLRLIAFSSSIPPFNEPHAFTTDELAGLLTHGVAATPDPTVPRTPRS